MVCSGIYEIMFIQLIWDIISRSAAVLVMTKIIIKHQFEEKLWEAAKGTSIGCRTCDGVGRSIRKLLLT